MPILLTALIFLLSINFLLGFPKAVSIVQSSLVAQNLAENPFLVSSEGVVAGITKINLPPKNQDLPPPPLSATASLVQDLESNFILFAKDPDKRVPIASTTKLMTALLGVEHFKPNEILTVPDISTISGSTMGLVFGEKLTFRSLLYGMLLNSGNDAAYTIAANFPGGVDKFVETMNQKAQKLGLTNSHFDNPAGLDSNSHFSSAADLAKIAKLASENSQLFRVVGTKQTMVASIDKTVTHPLKNLNKLLELPGVLGMKTGFTPVARENLVTLVERKNRRLMIVVLGSGNRFKETEKLIEWVDSNFLWPE